MQVSQQHHLAGNMVPDNQTHHFLLTPVESNIHDLGYSNGFPRDLLETGHSGDEKEKEWWKGPTNNVREREGAKTWQDNRL